MRVLGLSSVWVSDSLDGRRTKEDRAFVPNMLLARQQLEERMRDLHDDDIVLVLTHHPPEWMLDAGRTVLERYLTRRRHVHLCGHVHKKLAGLSRQLGDRTARLLFVAGAAHDEEVRGELAEHGYAWGAIRQRGTRWNVGWSPRVYVPKLDETRPDRTRHDLDDEGFDWVDTSWG